MFLKIWTFFDYSGLKHGPCFKFVHYGRWTLQLCASHVGCASGAPFRCPIVNQVWVTECLRITEKKLMQGCLFCRWFVIDPLWTQLTLKKLNGMWVYRPFTLFTVPVMDQNERGLAINWIGYHVWTRAFIDYLKQRRYYWEEWGGRKMRTVLLVHFDEVNHLY